MFFYNNFLIVLTFPNHRHENISFILINVLPHQSTGVLVAKINPGNGERKPMFFSRIWKSAIILYHQKTHASAFERFLLYCGDKIFA